MTLAFSDAKNGEKTCALTGKHFHSAYNPSREAEQWVRQLSASFVPAVVIVIEPALSYCVPFLRARFSDARLCAIRLCTAFAAYDSGWDIVFTADATLTDQLFAQLGEEQLCAALFFAWQPSEQILCEEAKQAWHAIKTAVLKGRDVLATRSFFAKRWIKNTIRFCSHVQKTAVIQKGTCDIIVVASGPSLRTSLPYLVQHRATFFLLAVSSALLPLLQAGITPDVVLSTDGGFWAKKHLAHAGYDVSPIPFAIAVEGACPTATLHTQTIVPLYYADGIETPFLAACNITAMSATRNGTVSGTAVTFALALTTGNVYACGLDLATAKGFQHTQPNALDLFAETSDTRLRPKATRIAAAACAGHGSLAIYRDWFSAEAQRLKKRFFRLSDSYAFPFALGAIRDVDWQYFSQHKTKAGTFPSFVRTSIGIQKRKQQLTALSQKLFLTTEYDGELCPIETLLQKRAITAEEQKHYTAAIAQKKARFVQELAQLV